MRFDFTPIGLDRAIARIRDIDRVHIPFAACSALNSTAFDIRKDEQTEMKRVFDRPTPFVVNSIEIIQAKKSALYVDVGFTKHSKGRDVGEILRPQIFGGARDMKRSERWIGGFYVPGASARLDRYGNMMGGQITQVLSALGALRDPYQNVTPGSLKRNKKPRDYFVLFHKKDGLIPGVYLRTSRDVVKPIMILIPPPKYRKRFHFYEVAEACSRRNFQRRFFTAMEYALRGKR
jgi:hypothetical protein